MYDCIQKGPLLQQIPKTSPTELHQILDDWKILKFADPYSTSFDFHAKLQQPT